MLDRIGKLKAKRIAIADRHGSPIYVEFHEIIANGASVSRETRDQFPDARKYEPLDHIIVTNNSDENLRLSINGNIVKLIPARAILSMDNVAVWTYSLENISATSTTANEVEVTLQRDSITADARARNGS